MTSTDHAQPAEAPAEAHQQPAVVLTVAATSLAAVTGLAVAARIDGAGISMALGAFVALAALTDLREIRLPVVGVVTLSFVPVLAALIELGLWEALVVAAVSGAATAGFTRDLLKVTFNVANYIVSTFAGGLLYLGLLPLDASFLEKVVPAFAATAVDFLVNTWLLAAVVSHGSSTHAVTVWRRNYQWAFPGYLAGATIAVVAAWLYDALGVAGLLLVIPPLFLIYSSYQVYVGRVRDRESFDATIASFRRELEASERLHGELRDAQLKVAAEIDRAQRIQLDLLPSCAPAVEGLRLAQRIEFVAEVGGDYYDYMEFGDGRWAIVCGDVMGKGLAAALIMAMARSLLRDAIAPGRRPAKVLSEVNDGLARDLAGQRMPTFLTLTIVAFDPGTRTATIAGGGHNPVLLFRDGEVCEFPSQGPALGVRAGLTFAEDQIELAPGERLAVFTDGLTEARSPSGELFGRRRLAGVLARSGNADLDDVLNATWREIAHFRQGSPATDDATLLLMEAR
ncbi:MAG TPA: PP2C family protein-serine/threonine phosphatase [Thermoleophilia bacterium]|nr:PP2C family protein-serine/threonine phosphatase [Thermoleophilia bacterium]HQG03613.1 PP2C family protein-serine/threonine phosphatase [Thermoleophilia bacterium]HQG54840.1 PP2C family protein-serine/threonine phosphatase [Thermoleophilia bacterium]HQJ97244.1 PP2C family protein-serine/threonine phosphatase [Thermoleophilia bacterium]